MAMLARGGVDKVREILERAVRLPGPQREKVLGQLVALSGLRRLEEKVTMELKSMQYAKYVDDHVFLREIRATALAEGRAEGEAKGKAEGEAKGKAEIVLGLIGAKFGPLPKWARARVAKAAPAQLERWALMLLTAETLDEVVGKR